MARGIEANGMVILNPRDMTVQSLFLADMDFRQELHIHTQWIKHRHDLRKAKRK